MTDQTALQVYDSEAVAIREAGTELAARAEAFVIEDDETDVLAKTVLAVVTNGIKAADARRVELKAPALAECKAIDAAFGDAVAPFKRAKEIIARKTGAYFAEKKTREEAARREAERAEREAAEARRQAEMAALFSDEAPHEEPAPAETPAVVETVEAVTRTEAGTVGMAKLRGYKIVDESLIPREFWVLDTGLIGKTYRSGGDVPGCVEDITYVPRTR